MQRRRTCIVAALAAGTLLLPAPAAFAVAFPGANGICDPGDFCAWRHDDQDGGRIDTPYAVSTYVGKQYFNSEIGANDSVSSARNRYNTLEVRAYVDSNYSGVSQCLRRSDTAATNLTSQFEDKISSHKGVSGTCP